MGPFRDKGGCKIAGGAEKADQGVKPFDVRVALKDTLKLLEQRLFACVGEKACGHGVDLGSGASGRRLGLGAVGGAGAGRNENVPQFHRPLVCVYAKMHRVAAKKWGLLLAGSGWARRQAGCFCASGGGISPGITRREVPRLFHLRATAGVI